VVAFRVGPETFGLPIAAVREIVRIPQITAVPNAPHYIEGVINLRGKIIPVVDLRKRFGAGAVESSNRNRIVVVALGDRSIGLIVSSASEVLRIPPSEIEDPHNVFREGDLDYITGVGKLPGRLVILLDLQRILRPEEIHNFGGVGAVEPAAGTPGVTRRY